MKKKRIAILLAMALTVSCMNGVMMPVNAADFSEETEVMSEEKTEDENVPEAAEDIQNDFSTDEADVQMEESEEENQDIDVAVDGEAEDIGESDITVEDEEEPDFSAEVNEEEIAEAGVNNTVGTATSIGTNILYKDNLVNDSDVNWYKFSVSKAGSLSITFKHAYIESDGNHWTSYIYDSNMNELSYDSYKDKKISETTDAFGIPAGTYYIKIRKYMYYYLDMPYEFKVEYSPSLVWEKEVNNTYSQANSIEINKTYYGGLQKEDDVDWYKFTVSNPGGISFTFNHNYIESSSENWKIYIYDSNMNELTTYRYSGNITSETTGKFGVPAGTYYIKVGKNSYYYESIPYNLKVNYDSEGVWEQEVNDNYSQADIMTEDKEVLGSLQREGDVDWYKFTIAKSCYVNLLFKHPIIKDSSRADYWKTTIYNARDMKQVAAYSYNGNYIINHNQISLSAGTYYIKVGMNSYYYSDLLYRIKYNIYTPPINLSKTKITVGSSTYTGGNVRPSVTVRYGNTTLSNGKDYTVSYSKASKVGKTVTIKISGKGNYTGSVTKKVKITKKPVSQLTIKGVPSVRKYTGKSIRPNIKVYRGRTKLKKGRDYTVSYGKNKKKGKGTIIIKGKGNYSGTIRKYFKIRK